MIERLELLKKRYEELNEELLNPEVLSDFSKQMKLSKEKSSIEPSVMKYDELKKVTAEIEDLKSLVNDPEMHEIASMELDEKHALLEKIKSELEILLYLRMKMMVRILLWKSEVLLVEMKLIFLLEIYLECIVGMLKK